MSEDASVDARVAALRRAFDASFAEGVRGGSEEQRDFLCVGFERAQFALPITELAAVEKRRKLVPLPAAPAGFRGLAGVRGRLVAVYDLGALLGFPATAQLDWLIVPRRVPGVAFGVRQVERYLRAPESAIAACAGASDARVATLVHGEATLAVLGIERLLAVAIPAGQESAP